MAVMNAYMVHGTDERAHGENERYMNGEGMVAYMAAGGGVNGE